MKFIYKISTFLLINSIFINSALSFAPAFSRDPKTYLVSELLEAQRNKFGDAQYLWKQLVAPLNPQTELSEDVKKTLEKYESWLYKDSNPDKVKEFSKFENAKLKTFTSLEDIEKLAKAQLNNNFSFDPILQGSEQEKNELANKILQFYNFIINSKLLTKNELLKLIYVFSSENVVRIGGSEIPNVPGYTLGNNLMQCSGFKKTWYIQSLSNSEYESGYSSTSSSFHTFVHEFAHSLMRFYALNSTERQKFNSNISQFNSTLGFTCEDYININDYNLRSQGKQVSTRVDFKSIDDITTKYLFYKINNNKKILQPNVNYYKFAKWIVVPSEYGRSSNDYELIAEAFAYWYLTPPAERNKPWGWLHTLFTKKLPNALIN